MALPEAKGREALAAHLVDTTEMTVDLIKATLAAAPAATSSPEVVDVEIPEPSTYEASRAAGAGVGGGRQKPQTTSRVDLVADMKRRHGVS